MKTLGASVVLTLALWSKTLLAEPAPWPIYVSARLPPACQGVADFAQRLLARTNRLRWASVGEPGIVFDVSAQQFPTGLVGQLQIRELSGRFTQRSVEGSNCDGVLDALAFVAAVLVDSEPEPTPIQPPVQNSVWQLPMQPSSPRPPIHFTWGFGVTAGLTSATAKTLLQPNLGLRASLAWTNPYFDPSVMVGFEQRLDSTARSTYGLASVATTFSGWAAHIALSPIRWPATGHYLLRPLAVFEMGQLTSNSTDAQNVVTSPPSTSRLWLASGLGASAEAPISSPLAAIADVSVLVPLQRWNYYYRVGTTEAQVFSVPSVGLNLRVGVILKFE